MRYLFISLSLLFSTHAYAARPFMTDDARLTTAEKLRMAWMALGFGRPA
jgi:hypothetical protein